MILRRIGNKSKLAKDIQKYFPKHTAYIEPFMGAGGMFFNKPKAKHNFLNDIDSDVFNLFQVIQNQKEEFVDLLKKMPIHNDLFKYWLVNKETTPLNKAVRFIMLSNFSLFGAGTTLLFGLSSSKEIILNNIDKTFDFIQNVHFTNCDFREMLKKIQYRNKQYNFFIYADPPYVGTGDNYSHSFKEQDAMDLLNAMIESKCKFAYSEFNNPFLIERAKELNLNIIIIGERQTLKNKNTEILITNYENNQKTLFCK